MAIFDRMPMYGLILTAALAAANPLPAFAEESHHFEVEGRDAARAIHEFGNQSNIQILASAEQLAGKTLNQVSGELSTDVGLKALLAGTGLTHRYVGDRTVALVRDNAESETTVQQNPSSVTRKVEAPGDDEAERGAAPKAEARGSAGPAGTEVVVVTGSRIRRPDVEDANPVMRITKQELEQTGQPTLGRALQNLPQNFGGNSDLADPDPQSANRLRGSGINLRGLGLDATLVLVNGRRLARNALGGIFTDLSTIPLAAVERVEILTDGASAIFGSDAIGGAVNVILRTDFTGLSAAVRGGMTTEDGYSDRGAALFGGIAGRKGRVAVAYDYYRQAELRRLDREFTGNGDYRDRAGSDFRSVSSNPGNVRAVDGNLNLLSARVGRTISGAAVPLAQDGRSLSVDDFLSGIDRLNLASASRFLGFSPEESRHSLFATSALNLGSVAEAYWDALLMRRESERATGFPTVPARVPASNPFNPFGEDVFVDYLIEETGPPVTSGTTESANLTMGVKWKALGDSDWQLDVSSSLGRERAKASNDGLRSAAMIASVLADANPQTSLNVFGDGSANNPATLASILGRTRFVGDSQLAGASVVADGSIARIPGGNWKIAAGGEWRYESVDTDTLTEVPGFPFTTRPRAGNRDDTAAFLETIVPLVSDSNGYRLLTRVDLQGAARYDEYSDFGSTTNYRIGTVIGLTPTFVLRASQGTSFKSPPIRELVDPNFTNNVTARDPQRNETVTFTTVTGGNLELQPEESDNISAGFVWQPRFAEGLSLSVNYFRINFSERILRPSLDVILQNEAVIPEAVTRAPPSPADIAAGRPGRITAVDLRVRNIAVLETDGFDVLGAYALSTRVGDFSWKANVAVVDSYQLTFVQGTAAIESRATLGNPPKLRGAFSTTWTKGSFAAALSCNFTDAYRQSTATNAARIGSYFTIDSALSYELALNSTPDIRLALGVRNLADRQPPFVNNATAFDPLVADPRGRTVYVSASAQFD